MASGHRGADGFIRRQVTKSGAPEAGRPHAIAHGPDRRSGFDNRDRVFDVYGLNATYTAEGKKDFPERTSGVAKIDPLPVSPCLNDCAFGFDETHRQ